MYTSPFSKFLPALNVAWPCGTRPFFIPATTHYEKGECPQECGGGRNCPHIAFNYLEEPLGEIGHGLSFYLYYRTLPLSFR